MSVAYDLDRTCRCCLQDFANDFNLKTLPGETIGSMLMEIANVQFDVNDGLPQNVCKKCADAILAASDFRAMCTESDAKLRKCFGQGSLHCNILDVKEENFIDVNDLCEIESNAGLVENMTIDSLCVNEELENNETSYFGDSDKNGDETCLVDSRTEIFIESDGAISESTHAPNRDAFQITAELYSAPKTKTKQLWCDLCTPPRKFRSYDSKHSHMRKHAKENFVKFTCDVCNAGFKFIYDIDRHANETGHGLKYVCNICDARFRRKALLIKHFAEHASPAVEVITASDQTKSGDDNVQQSVEIIDCESSTAPRRGNGGSSQSALDDDTTLKKRKPHSCHLCSPPRFYSMLSTYQSHLAKHADDTCTKFTCHTCDARFRWNYELNRHLDDSKHQNLYECDECDAKFTYKNELWKHKEESGHKKGNKLTCDICKVQLSTKRNLRAHMQKHIPNYLKLCWLCGKSFYNIRNFDTHMNRHSGDRPFGCDVCRKTFYTKNLLQIHKKLHLTIKAYGCTYCNKSFVTKAKLTRHVRIHTGERPFACSHCGKTFYADTSLKAHIRIHTGEKPFKCTCGERFSQSQALLKHRRKFNHFAADG